MNKSVINSIRPNHSAVHSGERADRVRVSVIIPTFNEEKYLPGLLGALRRQTLTPEEIIIADAGSKDATLDCIHGARVTVVQGGLPARGRNAGALAASGEILLFLDADVLPQRDFIEKIVAEFNRQNLDVATCLIESIERDPINRLLSGGTNVYFRIIQPISPHAPGFCILARKSAHELLGGFDETLFLSEDMDYARRAARRLRFGLIRNTTIPVSMRRVEKEGLVRLGVKYAWCELYGFMDKPVRNPPFRYEFGKFGDRTGGISRKIRFHL